MSNSWRWCAKTIYCSHWLQPLDQGIFRIRQWKYWWASLHLYTFEASKMLGMKKWRPTPDLWWKEVGKESLFVVFSPAFSRTVTVASAQGAFCGSGIFPVNVKAIPDHAYNPSSTTERRLQTAVGGFNGTKHRSFKFSCVKSGWPVGIYQQLCVFGGRQKRTLCIWRMHQITRHVTLPYPELVH